MQPKGFFVGSTSFDYISLLEKLPDLTGKQRAHKQVMQTGGLSANAAITFSALGGLSTLVTCLGNSESAKICKTELKKYQIDLQDIASENYEISTSAIIVHGAERCIISSAKTDEEINLKSFSSPQFSDILLIDGIHKQAYDSAIKYAKDIKIPCVWDADKWRSDSYYDLVQQVDIVIASSEFMPPCCNSQADVVQFFKNNGVGRFAITNGPNPIMVYENNEEYKIPVPAIKSLDTLGAGDVFHGAFCYHYARNKNFKLALEQSVEVASFSCQYFGRQWAKNLERM